MSADKLIIANMLAQARTIDVFWKNNVYPANSIAPSEQDVPFWLEDHSVEGPARYMDLMFGLVMATNSLYDALDGVPRLGTYVNVVITSKLDGQSAIKGATILDCEGRHLSLVGGIFVMKEDRDKQLPGGLTLNER